MYLKKSVEKFLVDQKIEKNIIEAIQERMSEVAGISFASGYLKYFMGDDELTQKYLEACKNDPDLLLFGLPN